MPSRQTPHGRPLHRKRFRVTLASESDLIAFDSRKGKDLTNPGFDDGVSKVFMKELQTIEKRKFWQLRPKKGKKFWEAMVYFKHDSDYSKAGRLHDLLHAYQLYLHHRIRIPLKSQSMIAKLEENILQLTSPDYFKRAHKELNPTSHSFSSVKKLIADGIVHFPWVGGDFSNAITAHFPNRKAIILAFRQLLLTRSMHPHLRVLNEISLDTAFPAQAAPHFLAIIEFFAREAEQYQKK